ncbi:MAG: glycosyltransferase, partial [Noviherbaspirillum sp.]
MNRKIIISSNTAWSIHNFRSGLIKALIDHGYHVTAVAPDDGYSHRIRNLGCRFIALPMDNHGTHPGRDLLLLARYVRLLQAEQPCVYLGYTIKPNVYGSLAASSLGIPVVNNIAGLGFTFVENSFLTRIVRALYKCGLYWSDRVFFQNEDDRALFIKSGLIRAGVSDRLPGSGIDLSRYLPRASPTLSGHNLQF